MGGNVGVQSSAIVVQEAIYEEMDLDYKKKANDLSLDQMYSRTSSLNLFKNQLILTASNLGR